MMTIIACVDRNWGIGCDGDLLFDIPQDMEHFKKQTAGKTVVMGRRTFDSLRVRPLPNRRNIVLTKNRSFEFNGVEVAHNISELLALTKNEEREVFVIGGSQVYARLLKYCDKAIITRVDAAVNADSYISSFDDLPEWKVLSVSERFEHKGLFYNFTTYIKDVH